MIVAGLLNAVVQLLGMGVMGGAIATLAWLLGPGRCALTGAGVVLAGMARELLVMAIAGVLVVASIFVGDGNG